jgi:hypothetical protein
MIPVRFPPPPLPKKKKTMAPWHTDQKSWPFHTGNPQGRPVGAFQRNVKGQPKLGHILAPTSRLRPAADGRGLRRDVEESRAAARCGPPSCEPSTQEVYIHTYTYIHGWSRRSPYRDGCTPPPAPGQPPPASPPSHTGDDEETDEEDDNDDHIQGAPSQGLEGSNPLRVCPRKFFVFIPLILYSERLKNHWRRRHGEATDHLTSMCPGPMCLYCGSPCLRLELVRRVSRQRSVEDHPFTPVNSFAVGVGKQSVEAPLEPPYIQFCSGDFWLKWKGPRTKQ